MRERSTWNLHEIAKQAADGDIYTMNQDHPQPGMDEYVIGDSSDFAEDVHSPNTWEAEYSGDAVKRNEIGLPELRADTFNHPEKTASDKVRLKKAELCVAVAKLMMRGTRTASSDAIEDQAVALMYMPDSELINTHRRLAQEQQSQEPDEDDDDDSFEEDDSEEEGQAQQKQARARRAGEIPPQFKENVEKMKAKAEDKDDDDGEEQKKQAGEDQEDDDADEAAPDQGQSKQAGDDDDDDEIPDFIQKKIDDSKDEGEKKQASKNARAIKKIKLAMGQQQQLMAQMQQLLQQAMDQQEPVAQAQEQVPPVAGLQGPALAQGQDDLDLLLDEGDVGPLAEDEIELEPTGLDTENVVLAGEDEILRSLFAQDEQGEEEEGQAQAQEKQAGARRTASTRTVGTRPTAGVTKLGGSVSKTASSKQVDNLSSLWASAPDVRAAFGLK